MKKILILAILILLTGCSFVVNETESEVKGINIFDENENILLNYIPKEKTSIKEITDLQSALILNSGEVILLSDYYIDKDKTVFIMNGEKRIDNIEGIYLTDNYQSITNSYYVVKDYIDSGKNVMVLLLDGFSYNQFKMAKEKEYIPFLSKYFKYPALSVFTPVTNAGYAAIITGKTPDINGVFDRSVRQMNVESIFGYCLKNNIKQTLIESDIKILNTEIEPNLHVDINKDGEIDDEIYRSTLKAMEEDFKFIFLHFHGIDDRGHTFGPYSEETMEYIRIIDNYLEVLSQNWEGPIVLVPDHGMHETDEGGSHGICAQPDMVVPYFIKE